MTLPRSEKLKTQPRSKAVFVRIDTAGGRPFMETRACIELVTTFIFNFRQQQYFDLIGFVVLPKELQMIILLKTLALNALVGRLEKETGPLLCTLLGCEGPIWDDEIYSETLDGAEAIKSRLQMMHGAPVRQRLVGNPAGYDFSSANPRFQDDLDKLER